jgi:hypothetical protein
MITPPHNVKKLILDSDLLDEFTRRREDKASVSTLRHVTSCPGPGDSAFEWGTSGTTLS